AAGSSDASARGRVRLAARQPGSLIGGRVEVGFIATAEPTVPQAISRARRRLRRGGKLVVASYLLAPGLFHSRLFSMDVGAVAEPLGADPRICDLIVTRMRAAVSPYRRPAAVTWR
ncbi:CbiX/SirB N-terminal domain-containing protein, partial [uncultured Gordonia sp.]|uniref:CbiX/SirB N-terminal domain-containing protein n=1 Tax=uncultured Gordonia sp. TaxID=198437 RepID=UPI00262030B2